MCGFKTYSSVILRRHKANHLKTMTSAGVEKNCQHCGEQYSTIDALNEHLADKHNVVKPPLYQCTFCGLVHKGRDEFRQHRKEAHPISEIYVCDICGYECQRRWNLLRHKVINSDGMQ